MNIGVDFPQRRRDAEARLAGTEPGPPEWFDFHAEERLGRDDGGNSKRVLIFTRRGGGAEYSNSDLSEATLTLCRFSDCRALAR